MEEEKLRFSQLLEEKHKQKMDDLRRSWRDHLSIFHRSTEMVNIQYDSLNARLDSIISSIEPKILKAKQTTKNLKADIESLQRSILRARSVKEQRMNEENSEMEIELSLKHRINDLKQMIETSKKRVQLANAKSERYKRLYLRAVDKQRSIRERERLVCDLCEMRANVSLCFTNFLHCIEDEQKKLDSDSEALRKMRDELLRSPLGEPAQRRASSVTASPAAHSEAEPYDAFEERKSVGGKGRKIQIIEDNIRTLLSTGNYAENDPIIKSLRKKIGELS